MAGTEAPLDLDTKGSVPPSEGTHPKGESTKGSLTQEDVKKEDQGLKGTLSEEVHSRPDLWGYDRAFRRRAEPWLQVLVEKVFRTKVIGGERPGYLGPHIFVANHCTFLPLDALILQHCLGPLVDKPPLRPLLEDYVFTLPYVGLLASRLGCVRACQENAVLLLKKGYSLLTFPEGVKGAGKTFFERDRIQRFGRGGLVRLALATAAPLVPVGICGLEEAYPVIGRVDRLGRLLGLPFMPVTPTFPLLGPIGLLPFPARVRVSVGSPIDLLAEAGTREPDEATILRLNEVVRKKVAEMYATARQI